MPYIALAIAAHLLASDWPVADLAVPTDEQAVLVERDESLQPGHPALSVWLPIVAEGNARPLSQAELARIAKAASVKPHERPLFVVDDFDAGRPRELHHDGGIAGEDLPGFDLSFTVFASSSLPPDLQLQLRDAAAAVEQYFERTIGNAVIGRGGIPSPVALRLALRVQALGTTIPGASQVRTVAVPMSAVTRKLHDPDSGSDGDDEQPAVPTYVDANGIPVGVSSLRVRYSGVSTAVSGENRVFLTLAQWYALGFGVGAPAPTTLQFDGTILMNSGFQWDYDPSDGVALNQVTRYSFQDYLVREVLIQLGWLSGIDFLQRDMTMLDMFRFSPIGPDIVVAVDPDPSPFTDPPRPIDSANGSANAGNANLASIYSGSNGSFLFPLDYNPGANARIVSAGMAIVNAAPSPGATPVDPSYSILANMISHKVGAAFVPSEQPFVPEEALYRTLVEQLGGLPLGDLPGLPVPTPSSLARPTLLDRLNRFDDGDWPAEPFSSRTRYPDGALPRVVAWPSAPRVQWNFNAGNETPSTPSPGASLSFIGIAPSNRAAVFVPKSRSSDEAGFLNRTLQVTNWEEGRGFVVQYNPTGGGAPAPVAPIFRFDIMLDEAASSTWQFDYSTNGTTFRSDGLPHNGIMQFEEAGQFQCGIRLDLLFHNRTSFTPNLPGPDAITHFRVRAVRPPGSSSMQSVSEARGGADKFDSSARVWFDMITVSTDVGAQLLVDYNPLFRGHMPRVVARGARAHLNFALGAEPVRGVGGGLLRGEADTEFGMGTGNSYTNSRASFMTQSTVQIPPYERFLMGQSSTAQAATIPRGVTYWTRNPDAYLKGNGPGTPGWTFLGDLPDFLSHEELLVLDHLGWTITVDRRSEAVPEESRWPELEGRQLHPRAESGYDETRSARP